MGTAPEPSIHAQSSNCIYHAEHCKKTMFCKNYIPYPERVEGRWVKKSLKTWVDDLGF